jgi:hypothetical protein
VYLEGTERVTIEGCLFTRNDGNAVMLSGYNRDTLIKDVEAVWNGDSVLASWGVTDGIDGTSGEQPRGTVVRAHAIWVTSSLANMLRLSH